MASVAAASSQASAVSRTRGLRRYAATASRSTSGSESTRPRQRSAAPVTLATPAVLASDSTAAVTCSARIGSFPASARRTRSGPITGYSATTPAPLQRSQALVRVLRASPGPRETPALQVTPAPRA